MNLVWYACYGSNLRRERFLCYLAGGRPEGAQHANPGCRDQTPPADDRPVTLPGQLYFAEHSDRWGGGGVAFLNPDAPEGTVLGRMYLITDGQFGDVVLQENGQPSDNPSVLPSFEVLTSQKEYSLPVAGWYVRLLHLGAADGHPIFTFTAAPGHAASSPRTAPSREYLRTIGAGLGQTYPRMSTADICRYLLLSEGVRGRFPSDTLASWLDGRSESPPKV